MLALISGPEQGSARRLPAEHKTPSQLLRSRSCRDHHHFGANQVVEVPLELRPSEVKLDECSEDTRRYNMPIILAGDLNLDASQGAAADVLDELSFAPYLRSSLCQDDLTTLLFDRGRSIDWMFTRGSVRAVSFQVHTSVSASDHYPLSVRIAFT